MENPWNRRSMSLAIVLVIAAASFFIVYPEVKLTGFATAAAGCDNSQILKLKIGTGVDGKYNAYANSIDTATAQYLSSGVNGEALIAAVITKESTWHPDAVSSAGALGLMQILPIQAAGAGKVCQQAGIISSNADLYDTHKNIMCGAFYLNRKMKDCPGSLEGALTAYYSGNCGYSSFATSVLSYYAEWQKCIQFGGAPTPDTPPGTDAQKSCSGRCNNYDPNKPCQCDSVCLTTYNDCCDDYQNVCGSPQPSPLPAPIPSPTDTCDSSKMECNTNRYGSDIGGNSVFSVEECRQKCNKNLGCSAWTYVKPGIQGTSGICWEKTDVPATNSDRCCTSGFNCDVGMECNTDYYGSDIVNAWFQSRDPSVCQAACENNPSCRAWTWVKHEAFCYLKDAVPSKTSTSCCTSGVKAGAAPTPTTTTTTSTTTTSTTTTTLPDGTTTTTVPSTTTTTLPDGTTTTTTLPRGTTTTLPTPAPDTCDSGKMECNTNRYGSDFYDYVHPDPALRTAEDCRIACNSDPYCKAWSFVKGEDHCWEKLSVPSKTSDTCCTSGFNCLGGMECNTDYYGSDIVNAWFQSRDPSVCQAACENNPSCRAWTWVKHEAFCYLKDAVPSKTSNNCCTSGVKVSTAPTPAPEPVPTPAPAPSSKPCESWCSPGMECCTDRWGGDIANEYAYSPTNCKNICNANPDCRAWTWVVANSWCWMKGDPVPSASGNDCCISGIR